MNDKPLFPQLLAEFLGTMVLIMLGDGVVAMVVLFGNDLPGEIVKGGYTNITIGWGLAVFLGVCVAGRISGGHINPAVTLSLAVFQDFPWRRVVPYMIAQVAGAFAGAALVFVNYLAQLRKVDPDFSKTAGIFTTFPHITDTWWPGFIDQVIGTALLLALVLAIVDPRNRPVSTGLQSLAIGLVVVAIGVSWGGMHGYAINPARDFGPRLFTWVSGFKNTGFDNGVFWVPIIGPLLGGLIGTAIYKWLLAPFMPKATPADDI